jgi:transcription initiation factor TFIIIB Brf1 subunit/transcription initiation factor TFIIB
MEGDFSLFDKLDNNNNNDEASKKCDHRKINEKNNCCEDCGIQLTKDLFYDKEWRYYGPYDNRNVNDPSRCHFRKNEDKNIYKDISSLNLPDNIVKEANRLYIHVVKDRIYRGNTRKSIIFACIFYAYKQFENPQSCDTLTKLFNITKKDGLKGLKIVTMNTTDKIVKKSTYITPINIIKEIMSQFDAHESDIESVIKLYDKVNRKSEVLSRARPQSVAAGLIRYYIIKQDREISMQDFREKVNLSDLTINRIVKEITRIIEC